MNRKLGLAAAMIALSLGGAGRAEDQPQQTPANAHLFLNTVVGQGSVQARVDGVGWNASHRGRPGRYPDGNPCYDDYCPIVATTDMRVRAYPVWETCTSGLELDYVTHTVGAEEWQPQGSSKIITLQFKKIAEIRQEGAFVRIIGNPGDITGAKLAGISLPSEALAARVAFALEFLRLECDPTAKTGF